MLLLIVAAAAQAVAPSSLAAAPAPAPAVEDKKVCQIDEDVTSRIRHKKVCLKQSEWDQIAKETQRELESSRNDRTITPNQ